MDLTLGLVIVLAVVVVMIFLLLRWGRRHDAPPLVDEPQTPVRSKTMATIQNGDSRPLAAWLIERASEQTGVSVADDPLARQRIAEAAVKAMEELQSSGSATISLPFLVADARGPRHFNVQLKRNADSSFELERF